MTVYVGDIISGGPQLIKSLELGIFGPTFLLMFLQRLGLVSNAKALKLCVLGSSKIACHPLWS
jgi:hypothetical protein